MSAGELNGEDRGARPGRSLEPLGGEVAPEFTVVGASFVEDAAAPTMRFELEIGEASGREVFTVALTAQINVDPARRTYDSETRGRLVELFGEPERWSATTHSFVWAYSSTLVPSFTGTTRFSLPVPCTYDLELAASKYFYGLPGGHVPLTFHFSGSILHRGDNGQIQVAAIPWSCSARWRMPVDTWRGMMERHYPNSSWVRLHPDTTELLRQYKATAGLLSIDAAVSALLDTAGVDQAGALTMDEALESLLGTLLYEGYALYPYTASAAKNATPTPFGIVYPPAYAQATAGAFDLLRLQGILQAGGATRVDGELRFLQAAPEGGHRAVERRLALPQASLVELATSPRTHRFELDRLTGRMRLAAKPLLQGVWRVALCVHNTTQLDDVVEVDRGAALRHGLLSTHPVVTVTDGAFVSPLERDGALGEAVAGCESVNTYPVLATAQDDVLLGAAIVLPDHPELAGESRGDLFDGTEIEEALLLHVLALSDDERAQIAADDPAVSAMIDRAVAATPEELLRLHGRTVLSGPEAA